MEPTIEVMEAFQHVESIFPQITMMVISLDGKWCFMDPDFEAPDFEGVDIDTEILNKAVNSVERPFIYDKNYEW